MLVLLLNVNNLALGIYRDLSVNGIEEIHHGSFRNLSTLLRL